VSCHTNYPAPGAVVGPDGVTDQVPLDDGFVEDFGSVLVVGCEHRKVLTHFFDPLQIVGRRATGFPTGSARCCGRLGGAVARRGG
jgi:hypothetical protein